MARTVCIRGDPIDINGAVQFQSQVPELANEFANIGPRRLPLEQGTFDRLRIHEH